MTIHAHALTSSEAFGTAGMMMPATAVMRCRMCAWSVPVPAGSPATPPRSRAR